MSSQGSLEQLAAAFPGTFAELRSNPYSARPIAISGPPSLVVELKVLLGRGGDESFIGSVGLPDLDRPELRQAGVIIYLIRREPTPADEDALRSIDRQGVPLLCVVLAEQPLPRVLPYVRATDVIVAPTLQDALEPLVARIARRCPDDAWKLAALLPALRDGVSRELVSRASGQNALLGAATFVPGADLPAITLNQARMLVRVAGAGGADAARLVPVALVGTTGAAVALRALARRVRSRTPLPAWIVNAAVAYAGTRLLGEAARRRRAEG
jgi:uncharacterized protein (DUF697 family)